jgi:two-component system sensor histidine kinase TctE
VIAARCVPFRDRLHRNLGTVTVLHDITALKKMDQMKSDFVSFVTHQLRTPLAVLKTQAQSAMRGDVEPQQALAEINTTIDRATQLANQMLALARVEQLRAQGDAPVIDWAEVARAVALDLSALIAERRIDFALDVQPAAVRAHEWALRELTRNLLHNAIQHSPPGELQLRLRAADGRAELVVADGGPGLSAEQRERLFQPFSGSSRPDGFGLGLAICQEIVHSLDGTLALRNRTRADKVCGLDAVVTLPLADNRA